MGEGKCSPGPWKAIENSWQYTTIYDAHDREICRLDLERFEDLNEETQDKYESIQRADAAAIVRACDHGAALRRAKAEGQLVWSSEIPKVPGWYWRRYTYEQTYMEVVHVDVSGAGIVAHSNGNGSWIQTLQREGVEWAGPIAIPLDACAAQIEEGE